MNTGSKDKILSRDGSRLATAEQRLRQLDIKLPAPPEPFGIYAEAVPSRPHDQRQTIARSSFFFGRQRHFMTNRAQIQLLLAKNSRPSSFRRGVIPQHAKPIAISPAPPIWPPANLPNTPQHSAPCSFLSLPTARPLDVDSHPPIKTHRTHASQRFSPKHF
jgi:hypothetical protein